MIGKLLRSTFSYILVGLVVLFLGVPCFLLTLLPARWRYDNKVFFWLSHLFYVASLKTVMIPIEVVGKENIPNEPAIIVANHQSSLDIPLIGSLLNRFPHVWLAKTELTRYWIGPIVSRMAVLIDMSSPQKALRSLLQAIKIVRGKRRHAIVFPEGGRYIGGNDVHEFFAGFVMIAKRTNRPVVPIMIFDAYKVYPPGSFFIHRNPVKVVVGKPFFMQEGEEATAFKDRVYQWFTQQVESSEH